MATVKKDSSTNLIIRVEDGVSATGKTTYKARTFGSVSPEATDEALFSIGTKLGAMQDGAVDAVKRQDISTLVSA